MKINNKLSKGVVTQNGCYISYKTDCYGNQNSFYQKLFLELKSFLKKHKIGFVDSDFNIYESYDSNRRKRCATITVQIKTTKLSVEEYDSTIGALPYEGDSIN